SSIWPIAIQFMDQFLDCVGSPAASAEWRSLRSLREADGCHRLELVRIPAGNTLRPRVDLGELLRENEALVVGAALVVIFHDLPADLVESNAFGPFVDAFEIAALLTVYLRQCDDVCDRLFLCLRQPEHSRSLDVQACRAGEVELEAGIDADDDDILAGRLSAVAGTSGDGHLELCRGPRAPHE